MSYKNDDDAVFNNFVDALHDFIRAAMKKVTIQEVLEAIEKQEREMEKFNNKKARIKFF